MSPFLCGYRKGFSTQTALVWLIEKWKHHLDKNGFASAILMDLSKVFDIINYDLLIANLHGKNALHLVYSYLKNKKQRIKCNMDNKNSQSLKCELSLFV